MNTLFYADVEEICHFTKCICHISLYAGAPCVTEANINNFIINSGHQILPNSHKKLTFIFAKLLYVGLALSIYRWDKLEDFIPAHYEESGN